MTWLANIVYLAASVLYLPALLHQMVVRKKNRRGWSEKLLGPGILPPKPGQAKRIWVHAVSLGEINATPRLVRELEATFPDRGIVVSTTTDTGYARACKLYGADRVFRYPLDFSWTVNRALDRIAPGLIVLVELEIWHNLMILADRRSIPVAVVNGRLTDRSQRRFRLLGGFARSMFTRLAWVGAQDERIADRFVSLGAEKDRVTVTGSMKWDTSEVADRIDGQDALATAMGIDRAKRLWVCGSTGPGEERLILDAYQKLLTDGPPGVTLAVVPRKPERFDEVAGLIRSRGFDCRRRSEHPDNSPTPAQVAADPAAAETVSASPVLLGDTMGELRKLYALADVVFVGRSLVPMGGSDPMEVAALAKPILVGPHMENFVLPTQALRVGGGLRQVDDSDELYSAITELLTDPESARRMGASARQVVLDNQGATQHTVSALAKLAR